MKIQIKGKSVDVQMNKPQTQEIYTGSGPLFGRPFPFVTELSTVSLSQSIFTVKKLSLKEVREYSSSLVLNS